MPQYYILQGVRRCVVARDAGLQDIPATIYVPGKTPVTTRIPLSQLHSPKQAILRDYRYIRYTEYPTLVLKTVPSPIAVEPLGTPGQKQTTPIAQVMLL
jgi:hypothetical protein